VALNDCSIGAHKRTFGIKFFACDIHRTLVRLARIIAARTKIQIENLIQDVTLNGKRGKLSRASQTLTIGEWSS
jgi:hypothetical protein